MPMPNNTENGTVIGTLWSARDGRPLIIRGNVSDTSQLVVPGLVPASRFGALQGAKAIHLNSSNKQALQICM